MTSLKKIVFSVALAGIPLTCALAQTAAPATGADNANRVLLKASGPYEDLTVQALAKNEEKIAKYLAAADAYAGDVVKVLSESDAKKFVSLREQIHQSLVSKDNVAAAKSSVTIFRLLVDRLDPATLVVPREVDLLDFAGYDFKVLASSKKPDWNAIAKLYDDSNAWWTTLKPRVANKHLRATVASAIIGLKQAVTEKNLAQLNFGAQMVLDLVDMMEDDFKAAKAAPAPAPVKS